MPSMARLNGPWRNGQSLAGARADQRGTQVSSPAGRLSLFSRPLQDPGAAVCTPPIYPPGVSLLAGFEVKPLDIVSRRPQFAQREHRSAESRRTILLSAVWLTIMGRIRGCGQAAGVRRRPTRTPELLATNQLSECRDGTLPTSQSPNRPTIGEYFGRCVPSYWTMRDWHDSCCNCFGLVLIAIF